MRRNMSEKILNLYKRKRLLLRKRKEAVILMEDICSIKKAVKCPGKNTVRSM